MIGTTDVVATWLWRKEKRECVYSVMMQMTSCGEPNDTPVMVPRGKISVGLVFWCGQNAMEW